MLWVLLFVGKARKTSFGVGSLPIYAVATRSRRKSSCYPPPLLSSMSHQTDSISVCGSARRQSIGKDEDKEEPFFIHRSEWSKWKADKRNSVQLQGSVLSSVPGPFFSCGSFLLLFLSSLTKTTYFFLDMDPGFSLLRKLFPNLPAFGEMGWVIRGTYPEEGGLRRAKYNCFINTGWRRHCNFLLL